jgi:hypothetical protein
MTRKLVSECSNEEEKEEGASGGGVLNVGRWLWVLTQVEQVTPHCVAAVSARQNINYTILLKSSVS